MVIYYDINVKCLFEVMFDVEHRSDHFHLVAQALQEQVKQICSANPRRVMGFM